VSGVDLVSDRNVGRLKPVFEMLEPDNKIRRRRLDARRPKDVTRMGHDNEGALELVVHGRNTT